MTILGIQIKHPTLTELSLLAGFILLITGLVYLGYFVGLIPIRSVWPVVSAVTVGVILNSFGISPFKLGWRAALILTIVASIVWAAMVGLNIL